MRAAGRGVLLMFLHGGMGLTCASPLAIARTIRLAPISRIARVALRMSAAPERMPRTAPRLERGMPKAIETDASGVSGLRIRAEALSGLPDRSQPFIVLGIETSCDDTAAAVVRSDGVILGEAIAKQDAIHAEWGGVVPGLARDAHIEAVGRVVSEAIAAAGLSSVADVDAIGVTVGPGLEICLRIGANHAVSLAEEHRKPFVAVHHLEAHCLMARLAALADSPGETDPLPFPFLSLLVSGGHCQLLLCRGVGDYSVIGSTLDDALGEAYDKVARLLGLDVGGGGGPALEAFAKKGDASKAKLPVPMSKRKDTAFSFAGLKTAVRTRLAKLENGGTEEERADLAAAFQEAAIMHIERRLRYALVWCAEQQLLPTPLEGEAAKVPPITSLVVSGGVAANQALRGRLRSLCEANNVRMYTPPTRLCTDNGVMVAWVAIERLLLGHSDTATGTEVRARWPLGRALDIKLT